MMMRTAMAAAVCLPGCAALVENDWHDAPTQPALRPYHVVIADAQMDHACGRVPWGYVFGCAVRIPSERLCLIYTRAEPAPWILAHERRHCDGWDHGPVQRNE